MPVTFWYCPTAHDLHARWLAVAEYLPLAQSSHGVVGPSSSNFPAGQAAQAVADAAAYVPGAHCVQADAAAALAAKPVAQFVQMEAPEDVLYFPASHLRHALMPAISVYCPAGQLAQDVDCLEAEIVPAVQFVQAVLGSTSLSAVPSTHTVQAAVVVPAVLPAEHVWHTDRPTPGSLALRGVLSGFSPVVRPAAQARHGVPSLL